jgi:hypothetical protein
MGKPGLFKAPERALADRGLHQRIPSGDREVFYIKFRQSPDLWLQSMTSKSFYHNIFSLAKQEAIIYE